MKFEIIPLLLSLLAFIPQLVSGSVLRSQPTMPLQSQTTPFIELIGKVSARPEIPGIHEQASLDALCRPNRELQVCLYGNVVGAL